VKREKRRGGGKEQQEGRRTKRKIFPAKQTKKEFFRNQSLYCKVEKGFYTGTMWVVGRHKVNEQTTGVERKIPKRRGGHRRRGVPKEICEHRVGAQ